MRHEHRPSASGILVLNTAGPPPTNCSPKTPIPVTHSPTHTLDTTPAVLRTTQSCPYTPYRLAHGKHQMLQNPPTSSSTGTHCGIGMPYSQMPTSRPPHAHQACTQAHFPSQVCISAHVVPGETSYPLPMDCHATAIFLTAPHLHPTLS